MPRRAGPSIAGGIAAVVGLAYAGISAYWATGGIGLLDTVGGVFERLGRSPSVSTRIGLWLVVLAKIVASVLPLAAVRLKPDWRRIVRALAWAEGVLLTGYGLVLTASGALVEGGLLHRGAHADQRALRWHAYLWDPWFLVWGLLVLLALWLSSDGVGRRPEPTGTR